MLTSAFAAVGAGRGAGGGRLPPAMGNAGSGGGAVAATESRARGHARPRGVCTPARSGGALAKTAVRLPASAVAGERGVAAAGVRLGLRVSSAGSAPLLQLPARTTPSARTRASRLVVDAALRVRSSRHVPASRRPDHRKDATRCARAAPHVGRRRVACVVAARLLF